MLDVAGLVGGGVVVVNEVPANVSTNRYAAPVAFSRPSAVATATRSETVVAGKKTRPCGCESAVSEPLVDWADQSR